MPAVIVTGASGGLGQAIARRFALEGWTLVLPLRQEPNGLRAELTALQHSQSYANSEDVGAGSFAAESFVPGVADTEYGHLLKQSVSQKAVHVIPADLSLPADMDHLFDEIRRLNIFLSALVNNAGLQDLQGLLEIDASQWDRMMAINLRAPHLLTRRFAEYVIRQRGSAVAECSAIQAKGERFKGEWVGTSGKDVEPDGERSGASGGRLVNGTEVTGNEATALFRRSGAGYWHSAVRPSIVNIASIEAERPAVNHSHYDASKAALVQYTRAAALELGRQHIRVNCVSPGLIDRPGLEQDWPDGVARYRKAAALGCLVKAEEVAETVWFLCSEAARGITGVNIPVDCGIGVSAGY